MSTWIGGTNWWPGNTTPAGSASTSAANSASKEVGQRVAHEIVGDDRKKYGVYRSSDGSTYGLYADDQLVNFFSADELRQEMIGAYYRRLEARQPLGRARGIPTETPRLLVDNLLRELTTPQRGSSY